MGLFPITGPPDLYSQCAFILSLPSPAPQAQAKGRLADLLADELP